MFNDDEDAVKSVKELVLAGDLSAVSVEELTERITLLEGEIVRIQTEITNKQSSKQVAESFFRN